jgi:putative tricarboxylic transport membrane protein
MATSEAKTPPLDPTEVPESRENTSSPVGFFILSVLTAVVSTYLVVGALTMQIPQTATPPGPLFFPTIVIGLGYALAVALACQGWRHLRSDGDPAGRAAAEPPVRRWRSLALAVGTFAAFVLVLDLLGWLISGALLFWGLATSLGSRRPVFDLAIALIVSSTVQLVFSAGLHLYLPVGILGRF